LILLDIDNKVHKAPTVSMDSQSTENENYFHQSDQINAGSRLSLYVSSKNVLCMHVEKQGAIIICRTSTGPDFKQ
jgi:hypothetical protein